MAAADTDAAAGLGLSDWSFSLPSFSWSDLVTLDSGETFGSYLANVADMNAPRGIRNKNPGNIKNDGQQWQGLAAQQTDPTFYQFTDALYGLRAIAHIFRSKQARGLVTPRQMISGPSGWAPSGSGDNNPAAYADAVAAALGVGVDDRVDLSGSDAMCALVAEIVQFENGQQPYGADYIAQAVALP